VQIRISVLPSAAHRASLPSPLLFAASVCRPLGIPACLMLNYCPLPRGIPAIPAAALWQPPATRGACCLGKLLLLLLLHRCG